jgi:hypothetical protein
LTTTHVEDALPKARLQLPRHGRQHQLTVEVITAFAVALIVPSGLRFPRGLGCRFWWWAPGLLSRRKSFLTWWAGIATIAA